jgi:Domain of unknown function (DUF4262)
MTDENKDAALELIRSNLAKYGHHIYVVSGAPLPRFAYTIGLSKPLGAELILAGASTFFAQDVTAILNECAKALRTRPSTKQACFNLGARGSFSIGSVDPSWANALMLGARDFFGQDGVPAWQVVPDREHSTLDIPDLAQPWSAAKEPCWQWLHETWTFPVSAQSVATTNLGALRGERVTEAARWELDQWELFAGAGPEIPADDVRVVPLGTLLAIDDSVATVTGLDVGRALWRDAATGSWQRWK